MKLTEIGESLWAYEQRIHFGGLPLHHRMTVIALSGGDVVLHSPTALDDELQEEIRRLGRVVAVIAPSWWHDLYLRETVSAFPGAALFGAPTLVKWNRSLPFAGALTASAPSLWQRDLDQHQIDGIGLFLDEVVFHHRPSRSLIVADLLFNLSENDTWITKALSRVVIGPYPGCRFARLYQPFVFNRQRFVASIEHVLGWDFDKIVVGHGALVNERGKEAFSEAFHRLLPIPNTT